MFEARGKRLPQSVEVNPLPKTGWANGGRCCPHSENPFMRDPSLAGANNSDYFQLLVRCNPNEVETHAGLAAGSVDEAA